MKILIGTEDIAGWIPTYKHGFENNGHSVTTAVFDHNPFYQHSFDLVLNETVLRNLSKKQYFKKQYLRRIIKRIWNNWINYRYKKFIRNLINDHDVIVYIWRSFLDDCSDLEYAKLKNKKIVTLFVGSDVRYFPSFKQEFDVSNWEFPFSNHSSNLEWLLKWIRSVEVYSDLIYSVPDQAGLQLRPYYHLQVPMITEKFNFNEVKNTVLKVLHVPSAPHKKGTDIIEETLKRLKSEGYSFDFYSVRNLPHEAVLELLSKSDILVDELVGHGPGGLSFEAMLSSCAVATRYLESSPSVFHPPVWSIDAESIYNKLKILLADPMLIEELKINGRKYALANNCVVHIVEDMLENLKTPRKPDYIPTFLRDDFLPSADFEIEMINSWTNKVKSCDWYKEILTPGTRSDLFF